MPSLIEKHRDQIKGVHCGWDRIRFRVCVIYLGGFSGGTAVRLLPEAVP